MYIRDSAGSAWLCGFGGLRLSLHFVGNAWCRAVVVPSPADLVGGGVHDGDLACGSRALGNFFPHFGASASGETGAGVVWNLFIS